MSILVGIVLILFAIEDLRTQKIWAWALEVLLAMAIVYGIVNHSFLFCLLGILPGILLFVLLIMRKEAIGIGDIFIAIAYGLIFGWQKTLMWLVFSFLLTAVVGLCWKMRFKKHNLQLPFVPFMALVHMGMCL